MHFANAVAPPNASMISETVCMDAIYRKSVGFVNRISVDKPCQLSLIMGDANDRLRAARKNAGFKSARAAAVRYGWVISTYASHENGQTPEIPHDAAKEYAKAFKVTAGWLLAGDTSPLRRTGALLGYVGAGSAIDPFEGNLDDDIDLPPGAPEGTGVVLVRGDSMYPRYMDGDRLFYQQNQEDPTSYLNKECVVELDNGGMLVKILRRGSKPRHFDLYSLNAPPIENQKVKRAWPVRWIERP